MRTLRLLPLATLFALAACTQEKASDNDAPSFSESHQEKRDPANAEKVSLGPNPDWAEPSGLLAASENATGLIFFRRNDTNIHLTENGQYTHQNQRIALLDSRALEIGNLSLVWNPDVGSPTVHRLLVHRDGDVIDILKDNSFEVVRQEDQLEHSMLNGYLTAILRVPDLRVGDELEWSHTTPTHDLTLGNRNYGMLSLAGAIQSGAYKSRISWESGQEPSLQYTDDIKDLIERSSDSVSISFNNPKIVSPPKDAPLRYSWLRILEYSDFENWREISKQFHNFFDDASKVSKKSDLDDEVKRIAKKYSGDVDRLKSALALVQDQVRYIYVGLNGGNYKPVSAEETWTQRYGDCKGKSALLLAMLRELNIDAELVLVTNSGVDDGFNSRLPSPALFDHIIIRAEVDGKQYWLDPTLPSVIEPGVKSIVPYRWVLPLSSTGETLEEIVHEPFSLPQEMGITEYDARAGFDQAAPKKRILLKRGLEGLSEYIQYSALTAEQLKSGYSNALTGSDSWDSIEDVTYRYDKASQASILTIKGTGPIDWDKVSPGHFTLSLPGGGFSPPSRRQRSNDSVSDIPFYNKPGYSCHATTVRLPEGTEIRHWGYNTTYQTEIFGRRYYRMMQIGKDRSIRMVRSSRIEDQEISIEKAIRDNNRLSGFDNSKATIEYNRNKIMIPWGHKTPVPATYEIDWTSPDVPCQPEIIQPKIPAKSLKENLSREAEAGDPEAQYKLGMSLQKGFWNQMPDEALTWLEKAALQDHKQANFELGRYYAFEDKDVKKAVKHLIAAEDAKEGTFLLADIYFKYPDTFPDISDARVIELYKLSAERDYKSAQRALAQRYKDGSMIQRDEIEALKWTLIANGVSSASTQRYITDISEADKNEAKEKAEEWISRFRKTN